MIYLIQAGSWKPTAGTPPGRRRDAGGAPERSAGGGRRRGGVDRGGALRDAVSTQDLPVVQALAMLIAAVYVVLNLLADIATIIVTPRLRTRL